MKDISHKEEYVKKFQDKLDKAKIIVLADCEGVSVDKMTALRKSIREADSEIRVVKNTLLRRAMKNLELAELDEHMKGATAITFGYEEDVVAPAKALFNFTKEAKKFKFKAGYMDGKMLTAEQFATLSQIPGRTELFSMLASAVQGPIRKLACVLDALCKKREEGSEGEAEKAEEKPEATEEASS
ncbi:MAG: 50S ribosomal protein L10 [Candidatus Rifleibacteriota bacterium]